MIGIYCTVTARSSSQEAAINLKLSHLREQTWTLNKPFRIYILDHIWGICCFWIFQTHLAYVFHDLPFGYLIFSG